jgi:hypothetical protein
VSQELLLLVGSVAGLGALVGVVVFFALLRSMARDRHELKRALLSRPRNALIEAMYFDEEDPSADTVSFTAT